MALHIVQFRGLGDLWVVQVLNQYWRLVLYLWEIMWILAVILNIVGKRAHIQILMCHPLVILCSFSCHILYFAQRAWNSAIAIVVAIYTWLPTPLSVLSGIVWTLDWACIVLQRALLPRLPQVSLSNLRCCSSSFRDILFVYYGALFLEFQLFIVHFQTFGRLTNRVEFHLALLNVSKVIVHWLLSFD
jgi:hypothetical protein